jgi:hypothetical protein
MSKGALRPVIMALAAVLLLAVRAPYAFAATAVSSCQTISTAGNYVLTTNLTSTATCILIEANNVALDLAGHTISANGTPTGNGIDGGGSGRNNIVIANGTITGYIIGINFIANQNLAINNMKVLQNKSTGINLSCASDSSLTGVTSANNGGAGTNFGACGTTFSSFNGVTVTGNAGDGITATGVSDNEYTNIAATNNGGIGLNLGTATEGFGDFVSFSFVSGNGGDGVDISEDSAVSGVVAVKNGGVGIHGLGCCNEVTASDASKNTSHGIEWDNEQNFVSNTVANGNGGDGILYQSTETGFSVVSGSTANGNTGTGFDLSAVGSYNLVNSVANNNNAGGASVACPSTVTNLSARGNTGFQLKEDPAFAGAVCTNLNTPTPTS